MNGLNIYNNVCNNVSRYRKKITKFTNRPALSQQKLKFIKIPTLISESNETTHLTDFLSFFN